jgi:Icc-related predicted phosphoesterase
MATGDAARESLVFDSKDYKNLTLSKAIAKYAPRKDKSGKIINDTAAYQKKVLASIGNKDKKMDDYTNQERAAILHAMMEHEGFEEGDIS